MDAVGNGWRQSLTPRPSPGGRGEISALCASRGGRIPRKAPHPNPLPEVEGSDAPSPPLPHTGEGSDGHVTRFSRDLFFSGRPRRKLPIFMHTVVCKKFIQMQPGPFGRDPHEPHENGQNRRIRTGRRLPGVCILQGPSRCFSYARVYALGCKRALFSAAKPFGPTADPKKH